MATAKKVSKKDDKEKPAEEIITDIPEQKTEEQEIINEQAESNAETIASANEVVAKAGKRSAKAIKEAEEKATKEARKAEQSEHPEEDKPKRVVTPTRSKLERRGKKFRKSAEKIDKLKTYTLEEAIKLALETSHVKFDATVELHVKLGVDPRMADQNIRDTLVLPAGTGKKVRVAVLTDDPSSVKDSGADLAGSDEILGLLEKGTINFDILIATPAVMGKLGKYARLLGPRGLMPSPKSGTVTTDVNRAVSEAKAGKVEYRVDSTGIIHLGIGKVSFTLPQLLDNANAVLTSIKSNKPSSIKGNYLKSIYLSTTMGPSIAVNISSLT